MFSEDLVKLEAIGFVLNGLAEQFEMMENLKNAAVLTELETAINAVISEKRGGGDPLDDDACSLGTESINWLESRGWDADLAECGGDDA
jgi:hypothetical protein